MPEPTNKHQTIPTQSRFKQDNTPLFIEGLVEHTVFYSSDNGFFVIRIKSEIQKDLVTLTGYTPNALKNGDYIKAEGSWTNNPRHGIQFKTTHLSIIMPDTLEGIEKYLASGIIKGIGPTFAKRLVKRFGKKIFELLEKEPERLKEMQGISTKRLDSIISSWSEKKNIREIMMFLHTYGIGAARATKIYKVYGNEAVSLIRQNPYRLASDIQGIGFKLSDEIAMAIGINPNSATRAQSAVYHVLQDFTNTGNCAQSFFSLVKQTQALTNIPESTIEDAVQQQTRDNQLIIRKLPNISFDRSEDQDYVYIKTLYNAERQIADNIKKLTLKPVIWEGFDFKSVFPEIESESKINLSNSQKHAIELATASKFSIITGGPGVGKTTAINIIIKLIHKTKAKVTLCAPTGRAAKRLAESTQQNATTIHRLLEYSPLNFTFGHNEDNPIDTDFLVVDESSMVDTYLMNSLLKSVPYKASVLLVGDSDQLPSVGPGAVLHDLIESNSIPVARMTEIFRQAATSDIITTAHNINQGTPPRISKKGVETDFYYIPAQAPEELLNKLLTLVIHRIPTRFGFNPKRDIQVLTPMNKGGLGSKNLNQSLQKALNNNPEQKIDLLNCSYGLGDKVIQTVNNYEKEVFNGDTGLITAIDEENKELTIQFDCRNVIYNFSELSEISLAYAITIHKSQGSEYPCVVIPLAMQHFRMLERNLFYTAITRGKKMVVLIAEEQAVAMATKNNNTSKRITGLPQWMRDVSI